MSRRLRLVFALALASGCAPEGASWDWELPEGYPEPRVPADNPMNAAKVELGRHLFYDTALSRNETQSCASCHDQARAFTEPLATSVGSTGEVHPRNAMSLTNVAYLPALTWANPLLDELEEQALVPLFGEHPVELGMAGQEALLVERLAAAPLYQTLFHDAYPGEPDPITVANVAKALGAFQRTLISHDSPYDRFVYGGDESALTASARRGAELFFSERLECFHCHGGFNFTDAVEHGGAVSTDVAFHNTGLYDLDGRGAYPADNQGLLEITGDRRDMGRFRAPTLRNIELTGPYFHDGSAATLEDALAHYEAGGRTLEDGPNAGVGSESPLRSIFVNGFTPTEAERADVLAFLHSLTDRTFITDPRFADPFAPP